MSDKQKILDFIAERIAAEDERSAANREKYPEYMTEIEIVNYTVVDELNAVAEFVQLLSSCSRTGR